MLDAHLQMASKQVCTDACLSRSQINVRQIQQECTYLPALLPSRCCLHKSQRTSKVQQKIISLHTTAVLCRCCTEGLAVTCQLCCPQGSGLLLQMPWSHSGWQCLQAPAAACTCCPCVAKCCPSQRTHAAICPASHKQL